MPLIDASQIYQMTNVGDHIDGTDVYNCNENLLDNAYFVGGGSQLGDGVFPINQRGLTSYSANAYGIDRWICYGGAITLASDGISVPANGVMTQPTANLTQLNGKTMTLSILYDSGMETGTAVLNLSGNTMFINNGASGQAYITSAGLVQFYKGSAYKVKAVKLELGTVSTLANDPSPNFQQELAKCQRYLFNLTIPAYFFSGIALYASDATAGSFTVTTPVPMRNGTPTVTITNTLSFGVGGTINSISWGAIYNNHVNIACTTSGGMTAGNLYPINSGGSDVTITISNEL